jgi:hypothetical protein
MHRCLYTAPLAEIGRTTTKQNKENCVSLAWTPTTPYDARLDSPSFTFQIARKSVWAQRWAQSNRTLADGLVIIIKVR